MPRQIKFLPTYLKKPMLDISLFRSFWGAFRRYELHQDYRTRREQYALLAAQQNLVYGEDDTIHRVRRRLAKRGYTPTQRKPGDIHTFAFIPRRSWHSSLYPDLFELGKVSEFDYATQGYEAGDFLKFDTTAALLRDEMNHLALKKIRQTHQAQPIDWVFIYASGLEITPAFVTAITDELGIPVVNMCLDDKQSWVGPVLGNQRSGQIDIAAAFDLSWTSARVACEWYLVEGARPFYLPEGFDVQTYHPLPVQKDIPISFVGTAYGNRPRVIQKLRQHNIPVQTFGAGWNQYVDSMGEIFNRSLINLGMGEILYSRHLTNVKGRDFEIPGTGGGVYLTSFNADLAQHFVIGKEILCYRHLDEMVELMRYYLLHPDEAVAIAQRGYERAVREHRWLHRYQRICRVLGILAE